MKEYTLKINEDEAIVLFEFFHRLDETNRLEFSHAAEYLALLKIASQIDKTTAAPFDPNYQKILDEARRKVAKDFKGTVPGMKD